MTERFKHLFKLPLNQYKVGSPIIVSAGSLLKDNETGKIIVQLKFHSLSEKIIKAIKVSITAYDISGKELHGVEEYQYLDLDVTYGQYFGSNKAIVMPDDFTRSFSIRKITIVFSDQSTWDTTCDLTSIPELKTLQNYYGNTELVKQYRIETNEQANYIPQNIFDLWACSCGELNRKNICSKCQITKENVFIANDLSFLTEAMNSRLECEEKARDIKRRQEEIEKETASKKGKLIKFVSIILALILVVAVIVVLVIELEPNNIEKIDDLENTSEFYEVISDEYDIKGDVITYGSYEQDNNFNNGTEPIEWIILEKTDNMMLIISKTVLDCKEFNTHETDVIWQNSSIRTWLNDEFYEAAFSDEEKNNIVQKNIVTSVDYVLSSETFETTDKLFLLSDEEVNRYFPTFSKKKCTTTEYAKARGAYQNESGDCYYWLRTKGLGPGFATAVDHNGGIYNVGYTVTRDNVGVRPVMWIEISE